MIASGSRVASTRACLALASRQSRVAQRAMLMTSARCSQAEKPQATDGKAVQHTSGLSPRPKPARAHSKLTVSIVSAIGRLMGYNTLGSTAIRTTSDMYDQCAQRADEKAEFWYRECGLPRTYQSWFQITNLHVHLLLTRFRALPTNKAQAYSQELINHFFIDAESRMRTRFGVQTTRLVSGYMREMHAQQRGAILGMDEALSYSIIDDSTAAQTADRRQRFADADAALATALWRNIWGTGGWGQGVGGVKRKVRGIDRLTPEEKAAQASQGKAKEEDVYDKEGKPDLARDLGLVNIEGTTDEQGAQQAGSPLDAAQPTDQLRYALVLKRMVVWYRRELARLAAVSDEDVEQGRVGGADARRRARSMEESVQLLRDTPSIATFSDI